MISIYSVCRYELFETVSINRGNISYLSYAASFCRSSALRKRSVPSDAIVHILILIPIKLLVDGYIADDYRQEQFSKVAQDTMVSTYSCRCPILWRTNRRSRYKQHTGISPSDFTKYFPNGKYSRLYFCANKQSDKLINNNNSTSMY